MFSGFLLQYLSNTRKKTSFISNRHREPCSAANNLVFTYKSEVARVFAVIAEIAHHEIGMRWNSNFSFDLPHATAGIERNQMGTAVDDLRCLEHAGGLATINDRQRQFRTIDKYPYPFSTDA